MNNDKKAIEALKAAQTLINYLKDEESFCSNIMWVDSKGYALHTDVGYLFEGLEKLTDLLVKRCKCVTPEYPKACAKYNNEQPINEDGYCRKLELLKEQPEIIRCKDCRWRGSAECPCCCTGDPYYSWDPEDDWFCADGERE